MKKFRLNHLVINVFLLLLLIQVIIAGGFGSYSMYMTQMQQAESVNYILRMYSRSLDSALDKIDNDLQDILGSRSTLQLLRDHSNLQRWHASYDLKELLDQKRESTSEVDGYVITDGVYQGFIMSRNSNIKYKDLAYIDSYMEVFAQKEINNTGWTSAYIGGKGYLWRGYNYGGVCIAALITENKVQQIMGIDQDSENFMNFYVTNGNRKVIYSTDSERQYGETTKKEEGGIGSYDKWYEKEVYDGAYYIIASVQQPGFLGQSTFFFIILGVLMTSFVFMVWIIWFMNREIIEPVKVLEDTSQRIRDGDLSVRPEFSCGNMEMTDLKETYITMLDTIMDLKVKEYERVIQVKESELKYMHMQIKPHFFLNALSTINSMAYQNQNDDIHEFIQVFSKNIRYMFRVGLYTVRLKEETTNVEKYLEMQRMMYKDCFYSYLDVPEKLETYPIPQMLLHTFVENIFKHVISLDTFTTILVQCSLEIHHNEEMLKIGINNSGKSFDAEVMRQINEGETEITGKNGIGLIHTKKILNLMYGQNDLMKIEAGEPDGTVVTIWIPKETKMEFKDEEI